MLEAALAEADQQNERNIDSFNAAEAMKEEQNQ